jgi:hypothetical protein
VPGHARPGIAVNGLRLKARQDDLAAELLGGVLGKLLFAGVGRSLVMGFGAGRI